MKTIYFDRIITCEAEQEILRGVVEYMHDENMRSDGSFVQCYKVKIEPIDWKTVKRDKP